MCISKRLAIQIMLHPPSGYNTIKVVLDVLILSEEMQGIENKYHVNIFWMSLKWMNVLKKDMYTHCLFFKMNKANAI